ncbi:MAG TPA: methyltransferase domain-containing protein [Clostridia bacterium]|nr:methyltransferase domain-containing protein [Clostridia bacterium]
MYGRFAAVYDKLMAGIDRDEWAKYLLSFLPEGPLAIADTACGTGALTLPLARAGHALTGLDASDEMLAVAAEKARLARLNIPFVLQRMEDLALIRRADAIVCACDGVNYLTSLKAVDSFFRAARDNLRPGGKLLFDISSRYKLEKVLANNTFAEDEEGAAYIWTNEYDEVFRRIRMDVTFFERMRDGRYERFMETHAQRAHSQRELTNALRRAGFCDIRVYEAFTQDTPTQTSERLQFLASVPERGEQWLKETI